MKISAQTVNSPSEVVIWKTQEDPVQEFSRLVYVWGSKDIQDKHSDECGQPLKWHILLENDLQSRFDKHNNTVETRYNL